MDKRWSVGVAAMLLTAGLTWGQQPGQPEGQPPTLGGIRAGDNADAIEVSVIVVSYRPKEVTVKVAEAIVMEVNGKQVTRTVYRDVKQVINEPHAVLEYRSVPLKGVEFYNLKWGQLAAADVQKRLKGKTAQPAIVIQRSVMPNGESTFDRPDSFYLRAFRDDTVIVVLPPAPVAKLPPVERS
jgi:hypothetical protein